MTLDTSRLQLPDPEVIQRTLSSLPFHTVQGVINFRDFGISFLPSDSDPSLRTDAKSTEYPRIRKGVLYRSGELTRLTDKGKAALKELGITTVFDLRSEAEIVKYNSATPKIDGVRFVRVPVSERDEYDPMALAARVSRFAADEKNAFASLYSGILEDGGPAYEKILKHLRDKPGEPFLVHCTAGKDRTGMFAAIVQLLLGVPDVTIAHDYHLTTYGLAAVLPALVERFQKETVYRDNWEGFQNMASAKTETMLTTLDFIRSKYGSAEGYVKARTSLTDEDITIIRRNLLVPSESSPLSTPNSQTSFSDTSSATLASIAEIDEDKKRKDKDHGVIRITGPAPSGLFALFAYVGALFKWIWRSVL